MSSMAMKSWCFDGATWFWTALTFAIAFATVAVVKFSKTVEHFV